MSAVVRSAVWRESTSAAVLAGVAGGACAAAIWQRTPTDDVRLEASVMSTLPAFRHRAVVDAAGPTLAPDAVLGAIGGTARWPAFARELRRLLALLGALDGLAPRSLRLECIDDDGCRLFHTDRVAARLLCTYVGAGTELLRDDAADPASMGHGGNRHVVDPDAVVRVPAGAVLVMRGALSPLGPGVLHRSPANPSRTARLLVAIDA